MLQCQTIGNCKIWLLVLCSKNLNHYIYQYLDFRDNSISVFLKGYH